MAASGTATTKREVAKTPAEHFGDSCGKATGRAEANETSALVHAQRKTATPMQLFVNLIVGGLGTGIFTLPWSTAGASVLPAIAIVAVVLLVNAWTISLLVEAAERHQAFDLGSLLGKIPGRLGKAMWYLCNIGVVVSVALVLVGYTSVAADSVDVFPHPWESKSMNRVASVLLASALILPVCTLDQSYLSFTSSLGVLVTANVFMYICSEYMQRKTEAALPSACLAGLGTGSIAMVSAMMQAIIIQMCVLPMYAELEDRTPRRFNRIVAASFSVLFCIFVSFSVVGYLTYGMGVQSNVLLELSHGKWATATRLGAGLAVVTVYPILLLAVVAAVVDTSASRDERRVATYVTVGLVSITALFVHDLGFINVVDGAFSLGVFVAVVPVLVAVNLLDGGKGGQGLALGALLLLGVVASVLGLVYTGNYAGELQESCAWIHVPE